MPFSKLIFGPFRTQIVPSTLKRQQRTESVRPKPMSSGRPEAGRSGEDRAGYRRLPGQGAGPDKKGDVGPGSANLEFVSSFNACYVLCYTEYFSFDTCGI